LAGLLLAVILAAPVAAVPVPTTTTTTTTTTTRAPAPEPVLTADPARVLPGASVRLSGTWCCFPGRTWKVIWPPTEAVVGSVVSKGRSGLDGSAQIPVDAPPGQAKLTICTNDVDANECASASITVLPPTLRAQPVDAAPGAAVDLSGEGWCCGEVTVTAGDTRWGTGTVDAKGELSAQARVPAKTGPGRHDLTVCTTTRRCGTVALTVRVVATSTTTSSSTTTSTSTSTSTTVEPTTVPSTTTVTVPTTPPPPPPPPPPFPWWLLGLGAALVGTGAVGAVLVRRAVLRGRPGHIVARTKHPRHRLLPPPVGVVVRRTVRRTDLHLRSDP
jgi:hypothetical protein